MKSKKYAREIALPGWNDVTIWKDFRPPYIPENIWAKYISISHDGHIPMQEPESANSRFNYHAHRQLCSIHFACEADGKIYFNHI